MNTVTVTFKENTFNTDSLNTECEFSFVSGTMTAYMYTTLYGIMPDHFEKLIDAVNTKGKYCLEILNSNGEIIIDTNAGLTKFEVSKYGSGNDADLCLTVLNEDCLHALMSAHDFCKKYFDKISVIKKLMVDNDI